VRHFLGHFFSENIRTQPVTPTGAVLTLNYQLIWPIFTLAQWTRIERITLTTFGVVILPLAITARACRAAFQTSHAPKTKKSTISFLFVWLHFTIDISNCLWELDRVVVLSNTYDMRCHTRRREVICLRLLFFHNIRRPYIRDNANLCQRELWKAEIRIKSFV